MFLLVSLQWIHIVSGKAAKQAHQGFSCVGLSYMGITLITWAPYSIALGTGPGSIARNHNENGLLIPPTLLTGERIDGSDCWLAWVPWPRSMGNGVGISIVFSFSCWRTWGRSLGIDSLTASSNILHPSATVLCPSDIMVWPAATFLIATTKFTLNKFSSTSSTFISISIIKTSTNIINLSHMIDIPVNIFLFISLPFW